MEAWQAAMLAVVALLCGALLPVLYQLGQTLRAVREAAIQAAPAIASIAVTAQRLERLTAQLEEGGRLERGLAAVDSLSQVVARLQETARTVSTIGAAVIPAVAAAVQAWHASREERGADHAEAQATDAGGTP